ncbi:MAG TPA: hypothetical protein DIT62_03800 [Alphaproteobacteria bacterium]|nr:hypothetical protein [Alphaproteobacteria bacterium]
MTNIGTTNAGITNTGTTNARITNTGIINTGTTNAGLYDGVCPDKCFANNKSFASILRYIGNFIEDLSPYSITHLIVTGDFSSPVRRQLILISPIKIAYLIKIIR